MKYINLTLFTEMEEEKKTCVLCTDNIGSDKETRFFDEEKWTKVKQASTARLQQPNSSKSIYWKVCNNLPLHLPAESGYHSPCYSKFTSIPKAQIKLNSPFASTRVNPEKRTNLRSQTPSIPTTSSGVFIPVCIFCSKARRKFGNTEVPLVNIESKDAETQIRDAIFRLSDKEMMSKVANIDMISKKTKYHDICKRKYMNKLRSILNSEESCSGTTTSVPKCNIQKEALNHIFNFTKSTIIQEKNPKYLTSIYAQYIDYLEAVSKDRQMKIVPITSKTLYKII